MRGPSARAFAVGAAAVFVLVTAYALATKVPEGRLAHDWLHSVLHVASAVVGLLAAWSRSPGAARWFTRAVAVAYLPLAVVGLFSEGLLLGTPAAIPLAAADNVFHGLMGGAAAWVLASTSARPGTASAP